MPAPLALTLALLALAAALAAAVTLAGRGSEGLVAICGAAALVALGAISATGARHALASVGPTIGFLAALLVLAEGCRREGLFSLLGALIARVAPERLFAVVFMAAAAVTVLLGLDATVVLLTPVVLASAARLAADPKPHLYACSHLANSASLLLPISNLTNLLAFAATGLSFTRFAALMALPWAAVLSVEWIALRRFFARDLHPGRRERVETVSTFSPSLGYGAGVVALTLAGFAVSSAFGVEPVWIAFAGAVAINAPALARRRSTALELVRAAQPAFLAFVLGLAVIVRAAGDHGLHAAVQAILPAGTSLPDLLAVAVVAAALANIVNNIPATLILLPVAGVLGTGPILAVLVGVDVGPTLTYAGSLATLLWRRVLRAAGTDAELREFTLLSLLSVPAAIVVAVACLWLSLKLFG